MHVPGRTAEMGDLHGALDRPQASVIEISGLPGSGKSHLARAAAADYAHVLHRAPPLPDPTQRASLAASLARGAANAGLGGWDFASDPPPWEELLRAVADAVPEDRPLVLLLDDAHRLGEARSRFFPALNAAIASARASSRVFHVVLVAPEPITSDGDADAEFVARRLRIGPLRFRAAAPFLPGGSASDRLRGYTVFGGLPKVLRHLDPDATLGTNIRKCLLEPDAPLFDFGVHLLERLVQTPSRYAAILWALSEGESDWGSVHAGVADLTTSGQVAPYLKRLEEIGLIEARRSLDAGPRGRSRRYRITDPLLAFWFRFLFPRRSAWAEEEISDVWQSDIRPALDEHFASVFSSVCRQYMTQDAMERFGANARECGSLWAPAYDIPIAGMLSSGAAFYGCHATEANATKVLATLDRAVGETRYGFGREARVRILFADGEVSPAMVRAAARRHDVDFVTPGGLEGS